MYEGLSKLWECGVDRADGASSVQQVKAGKVNCCAFYLDSWFIQVFPSGSSMVMHACNSSMGG